MEMKCGGNVKKAPEILFPRVDAQLDKLPNEMPLRPEDVCLLCPKADPALKSKPWVVSMPEGKESFALYALSNRLFTITETGDRVVVHPKLD